MPRHELTAIPQPGDFCCVPVSGPVGRLIRAGERLNGSKFSEYQHAEIFMGRMLPASAVISSGLVTGVPGGGTRPDDLITRPHGWTFSAYPGGARLTELACPPEELPGALWSSGSITLTQLQRDLICAAALRQTGTPYSWLDYWALALHRWHINDPALQRYIASTQSMICSQLVDWAWGEAGVHLFTDGRWPGYVTPADLAAVIESRRQSSTFSW